MGSRKMDGMSVRENTGLNYGRVNSRDFTSIHAIHGGLPTGKMQSTPSAANSTTTTETEISVGAHPSRCCESEEGV